MFRNRFLSTILAAVFSFAFVTVSGAEAIPSRYALPSEALAAGRACGHFIATGEMDGGILTKAGLSRKSQKSLVWRSYAMANGKPTRAKIVEVTFKSKRTGRYCEFEAKPQTLVLQRAKEISPKDQAILDAFLQGVQKSGWKPTARPAKVPQYMETARFFQQGGAMSRVIGSVGHHKGWPYLRTAISEHP